MAQCWQQCAWEKCEKCCQVVNHYHQHINDFTYTDTTHELFTWERLFLWNNTLEKEISKQVSSTSGLKCLLQQNCYSVQVHDTPDPLHFLSDITFTNKTHVKHHCTSIHMLHSWKVTDCSYSALTISSCYLKKRN